MFRLSRSAFFGLQERGQKAAPEIEALGEEERFSSVLRGETDAQANEDEHDRSIDDRNDETFGDVGGPEDSNHEQVSRCLPPPRVSFLFSSRGEGRCLLSPFLSLSSLKDGRYVCGWQ